MDQRSLRACIVDVTSDNGGNYATVSDQLCGGSRPAVWCNRADTRFGILLPSPLLPSPLLSPLLPSPLLSPLLPSPLLSVSVLASATLIPPKPIEEAPALGTPGLLT